METDAVVVRSGGVVGDDVVGAGDEEDTEVVIRGDGVVGDGVVGAGVEVDAVIIRDGAISNNVAVLYCDIAATAKVNSRTRTCVVDCISLAVKSNIICCDREACAGGRDVLCQDICSCLVERTACHRKGKTCKQQEN